MGSGLSIIPGMVDYSKTDLRFPTSGQQAHDAQIIHLVLFIHSLEMFIFSLWGLTPLCAMTPLWSNFMSARNNEVIVITINEQFRDFA